MRPVADRTTHLGSIPSLSLTATFNRCLQPIQRSVVCTETCPRRNWICSSSPPESWQSRAHDRLRSCGARRGMFMLAAVSLTTCQTVFSEMLCPQSLPARQTHRNTDHLRYRLPLTTHRASLSPNSVRGRFVCAFPCRPDQRWSSAPREEDARDWGLIR
jgi:hypothetical protein